MIPSVNAHSGSEESPCTLATCLEDTPILEESTQTYVARRQRNMKEWQSVFGSEPITQDEIFNRISGDAAMRSWYTELLKLTLEAEKTAFEEFMSNRPPLSRGQWAVTTNGVVKIFDSQQDAEREFDRLLLEESIDLVTECIPVAVFILPPSPPAAVRAALQNLPIVSRH